MGLWSRKICLLVVVAVVASLCGPADGFILDRKVRQVPENQVDGTDVSTPTQDPNPPVEMGVGCQCEEPPAMSCDCGVTVHANILGNQVTFDPKIRMEFIDKNVSIVTSLINQGKVLFSHEISARKRIPAMCVPLPQFPLIVFCLEFHNLTTNVENKTVSFCTALGVNTAPFPLPGHPTLPVGCFRAGQHEGLKYSPPVFKFPGIDQVDKLIQNNFAAQLDGIRRAVPWPFNINAVDRNNKQLDKLIQNNIAAQLDGIRRAVPWPFGINGFGINNVNDDTEATSLADKTGAGVGIEINA